MVVVYTLARVKPHQDREVHEKIRSLAPVKEIVTVYGEYDLIAKLELESLEALDDFIFNTIRAIEGVEATMTLISARPPSAEKTQP